MTKYTPEQRINAFWNRVSISNNIDDCWIWNGQTIKGGYGQLKFDHKTRLAHRVSYMVSYGEIPDNLDVLHSCDNPRCVNPYHLSLGTQIDNAADMKSKHRQSKCEDHYKSKLTSEQVKEIRERYAKGGISQPSLAKEYNVRKGNIWYIIKGLTWKDME